MRVDLNGMWKLHWKPIRGGSDVPACDSSIDCCVPGDVHEDLIRVGLLPEPLLGVNAPAHKWVEEAVFDFEREFAVDSEFDCAEITAHGLDCFAKVYIDSNLVGSTANAFVPHVFDVTKFIKKGQTHRLRVRLDTGVDWAKAQDASKYINDDDSARVFLRKSQFSFGWDWAPRLVTCGIWRDVELKLYSHAALRDVRLGSTFDGCSAKLEASASIQAYSPGDYLLRLRAVRGSGVWQATQKISLGAGMNDAAICVDIDSVARWYPIGCGEQALYDVSVEIEYAGDVVDGYAATYGFREVSIREEPLGKGEKSFIINVNGIDVFCKGANWVPADSICARVTDEKYKALVLEAKEANFNMFRIWGGGIYEDKTFYDLCDRHGIMVWQDFMFACSEYPADHDWFVENVRDEAIKVVRRLRDHASIVLWSGNNECAWYRWEATPDFVPHYFGSNIFHQVLPEVCAKHDPGRPYWPGSPYGDGDPNGEDSGDTHAWKVSISLPEVSERANIRNYRKDRCKFASEYGLISYAMPRTILEYTENTEIDFSCAAYKLHDNPFNARASDCGSLTEWYLKVGFGSVPEDELTRVEQSLAYQAMGYREAIACMRSRKFECAGSLFWMYSDCWGTLGWTIIDYYLRRKPSFYWVRKAYAPLTVFARVEDGVARAHVVNDTMSDITLTVNLEVGDISGNGKGIAQELVVPANSAACGPELQCGTGYAFAGIVRNGVVEADDLVLTHFPSEMTIPKVRISTDVKRVGEELEVTVSSDGFGHFVYLDLPEGAIPSDNYFNLLPARPRVIRIKGMKTDEVKVRALNLKAS